MNATDTTAARTAAIGAAIDRIRGLEAEKGVTRQMLEGVHAELLNLAAQEHLFPTAVFPPPAPGQKGANRYLLHLDDGTDPDRCELRLREEVIVEPGRGICFMPEDIHSIHTTGDRPTRHLHMYGLALERLDDRKAYDAETGTVTAYNRNFMKPSADAKA